MTVTGAGELMTGLRANTNVLQYLRVVELRCRLFTGLLGPCLITEDKILSVGGTEDAIINSVLKQKTKMIIMIITPLQCSDM